MRYLFLKWEQSIFVPRHNFKFFPGRLVYPHPFFSWNFSPQFLSGRCAAVLFDFSLCVSRKTAPVFPASRARGASRRDFSPSCSMAVFLMALRDAFSPAAAVFFVASHPRHPQFSPLRGSRRFAPRLFSPAAPDFSPAASRPIFSPEQSALCSLEISPLTD